MRNQSPIIAKTEPASHDTIYYARNAPTRSKILARPVDTYTKNKIALVLKTITHP